MPELWTLDHYESAKIYRGICLFASGLYPFSELDVALAARTGLAAELVAVAYFGCHRGSFIHASDDSSFDFAEFRRHEYCRRTVSHRLRIYY